MELLQVNYLPALRFGKNKYFVYFFAAALSGPITVAINHFFKVNSYSVIPFISPVLLLALPKREIKQIIFSLLSLLILFPHFNEHKIIPLMITTLNSAYIIFLLCEDLFNEIKINSFVPLFLPFLIMDILRGTINYYLYYENIQLLIRFASLFAVMEIITVLLIAYFGPSANVRIKHKKGIVQNSENKNPVSPGLQIIQIKREELFRDLTNMETKVLSLLGEGYNSKEISAKLFVTSRTVYFHINHIKAKLHISKTSHLAKFATINLEKIHKTNKPAQSDSMLK